MTPAVTACVRLNPRSSGEVVWGERLDPARLLILNVPLPESRHRFRDIVLNDGAENGTRVVDGDQVPVFDELGVWRASEYSTLRVRLLVPLQWIAGIVIENLFSGIRSVIWCAQGDDLRTFLAHFVAALPQIDFPGVIFSNVVARKPEGCARLLAKELQ